MNQQALSSLSEGAKATVERLLNTGPIRRRLLDIGLVEGTGVQCLQKSPSGDPTAYLIRGAVIALRAEDAQNILIMTY
jgi:ferrous iron transport protein A